MPELAEVAYYRDRWGEAVGRRVAQVALARGARVFGGREAEAEAVVRGQVLREARSHGKRLFFRFGMDRWLAVHLGMTGKLTMMPGTHGTPGRHDHLVLRLADAALVFCDPRRFGSVRAAGRGKDPAGWADRPPAVDEKGFTRRHLHLMLGKRRLPLKAFLLDQDCCPGIGNWMADEILWRCGWQPGIRTQDLGEREIGLLFRTLRLVVRGALRHITPDWGDLPPSWLMPHRWRPGGGCPRCRSDLMRLVVAGRTTVFCPVCQRTHCPARAAS